MSTLIGQKLGKYEIVERLAQGGMAEVYRAHQPGVERSVVIKVLHCHLTNSESFVARFRREARAVGALQHQHIVRIIDFDTEGEIQYMVMDFVQGGALDEYLKDGKRLSVANALQLGVQLGSALIHAHQQGVIHRDIKPGNILFAGLPPHHAVLTDFGLAHLCNDDLANLTVTGALIGTPTYMSPETVRGEKCDERSDIYSLGVVLYQLMTGKTPYTANTPYSMMMKLANEALPSPRSLNPDLSPQIEVLLLKALAKEPAKRFQNATEFVAALRAIPLEVTQPSEKLSATQPNSTSSAKVIPRLAIKNRLRWLMLSLAASAVLAVALIFTELMMV